MAMEVKETEINMMKSSSSSSPPRSSSSIRRHSLGSAIDAAVTAESHRSGGEGNNHHHHHHEDEDNEVDQLQWATIERLPTLTRLRTSLFDQNTNNHVYEDAKGGKVVTDVTKLVPEQKHVFISKLIQKIEQDNHDLLQKLRDRIARYLHAYVFHSFMSSFFCFPSTNYRSTDLILIRN